MILNSLNFLFFFILFFILYWSVFNKNLKVQNFLILFSSYLFYAWSDWRFLSYLIGVSILNFYLGLSLEKATKPKHKSLLLYIGLFQGIGGLAFFKYFNFFILSFHDAFKSLGIDFNLHTLNILIPLGISFFTFRTISYLLDIDKGEISPTTDWVVFFTYISFFPSVLSGPIDKARTFIPQMEKKRVFDYNQAEDGLRQIIWGIFKKVVIADNCSIITSQVFDNYSHLHASSLLLGAFLYTIQIYADFSGYSDMAIGISRLIGFNITKNFDFPFFSQNIAEFWRKWHISLTSWLTEYVFTPLSFSFRTYGKLGLIFAILINFILIGIWHGANWTYALYGFLHGCYYIPLILKGAMNKKKMIALGKQFPSLKELINVIATFCLVMFTLVIFRSQTIGQAYNYYNHLCSLSLFSIPETLTNKMTFSIILISIIVMFVMEWYHRDKEYGFQIINTTRPFFRWSFYYAFIFIIIFFGNTSATQFIYIQF